eukprot:3917933-Pleurochrysis_carterae.AAC.1
MLYADAFTVRAAFALNGPSNFRCRRMLQLSECVCVPRKTAKPVNALHGQAHSHSIMAVMYCILNLHPTIRMSIPAIQVATLTRDIDAKAAGMVE